MVTAEAIAAALEGRGPLPSYALKSAIADAAHLDKSTLEGILQSRPDLFVAIKSLFGGSWVLAESQFDPKRIVMVLEQFGSAPVRVIATALNLSMEFVLAVLRSFDNVFSKEGYGPPMWSLRLSGAEAVSLIRSTSAKMASADPRAERPACQIQYEESNLKRRVERARHRLTAMLAEQPEPMMAPELRLRMDEMLHALAVADQRDAAKLAHIERETERLDRELHGGRSADSLPTPHRQRPLPVRAGSYGRRRCGHSGRCGCG